MKTNNDNNDNTNTLLDLCGFESCFIFIIRLLLTLLATFVSIWIICTFTELYYNSTSGFHRFISIVHPCNQSLTRISCRQQWCIVIATTRVEMVSLLYLILSLSSNKGKCLCIKNQAVSALWRQELTHTKHQISSCCLKQASRGGKQHPDHSQVGNEKLQVFKVRTYELTSDWPRPWSHMHCNVFSQCQIFNIIWVIRICVSSNPNIWVHVEGNNVRSEWREVFIIYSYNQSCF